MYAALLKACDWNNTQEVDIVKHVTSIVYVFLEIKSKRVREWLYIKGRDMFVCILFCGFNATNDSEALVRARAVSDNSSNEHSAWFQKQHISASDRLLFNTNELN